MQPLSSLLSGTQGEKGAESFGAMSPLERAVCWVRQNRLASGGIAVHHKSELATPEVTGYLIPSLLNAGDEALAEQLALWEASVQKSDGSFDAPDGVPYTFDTAQVIRGFLSVLDRIPRLEEHVRRACDYVERHIDADGRVTTGALENWKLADGNILSEYCNLYVLPPLVEAGRRLGEPRYVEAAQRGLDHFKRKPDLVEFKRQSGTLSHMFGYMMEALVDLGEVDLAQKGLAQAERIQLVDGSIPAYPGATWTCSTGTAQLAIAWLKLGRREPALRALHHLERLQHRSGGFFGSYGEGAIYFMREEISWAVKFFIDAELLAAGRLPARSSDTALSRLA
jgi:malonyl-CoA O-methyltransferase